MTRRLLLLVAAPFLSLSQQKTAQQYSGPRPSKPDLPYLKHASNLIPTEIAEAKEEKKKDDTLYAIPGGASTAKTPLAMPIFLMKADKLSPDRLRLFRLDSRDGRREILFSSKKGPAAIHMEIARLSSDNIYKIEVDVELEPGEYVLSPEGSNQVFCFQVY